MDDALEATAGAALVAAPCSVEMPAGTGKTHLLAAAAAEAAHQGDRSLILTHTNAGVDAIRKRLKRFRVPPAMVHVDTITSWAFSLVRAYSRIAGVTVPDAPDWSSSDAYVQGATLVAGSRAILRVNALSFDYMFVDEYQDCTLDQHDFVLALARAVPRTVIFGDRMQAIFGFAGPLADWDTHVLPGFPALAVDHQPHRWLGHNPALGQWLMDIRPLLVAGQQFDFTAHSVEGLEWVSASPTAVAGVAHGFRDFDETVVLLDKWPNDVAAHASRLGGTYSVMEDIQGNFMRRELGGLPKNGDQALARWLAGFAKQCIVGLAGLDAALLSRLGRNLTVGHLSRAGLEDTLRGLDDLLANPTYDQLGRTARTIQMTSGLSVYRWEAWKDSLEAIAMTAESGADPLDSLAHVRDRLRRRGRASHARVASRTLLVKGLEYDHVIIADAGRMTDRRNLYVAFTRARKSITVIGRSSTITLRDD